MTSKSSKKAKRNTKNSHLISAALAAQKLARTNASNKTVRSNMFYFRGSSDSNSAVIANVTAKAIETASKIKATYEPIDYRMFSAKDCCDNAAVRGNHWTTHFSDSNGFPDLNAAYSIVRGAREKILTKSDKELMEFLSEEVDRCKICEQGNDRRFKMCWNISGVRLCRKSWADAYGISENKLKTIVSGMKKICGGNTVFKTKRLTDASRLQQTFAGMRDVFATNGLDYVQEHIQGALIPESNAHLIASVWLSEYFECFDKSPEDEDLIYIQTSERADVYEEYDSVMKDKYPQMARLSKTQLLELWRVNFPLSQLRPLASVLGKCTTCAKLDNVRASTKDHMVRQACKQVHAMHRGGLFMAERLQYKKRVFAAGKNPKILSIIIDGMDQNKTHIPKLSTQDQFPSPLEQHVTAVRRHHHGIRFYCTHNTVHKGANLTIYCLLSELEAYRRHMGRFPEEFFIQLDGGAENANQEVLALLELLVVKRIVRLILYTRLPTGHAHEDIDAVFGTLSTYIKPLPLPTLEDFYNAIRDAFKDPNVKVDIIPVDIIPDYKFLSTIVDQSLSRLHKGVQTQHQWRFEACEVIPLFPGGCKTTYRAYSSAVVVEFEEKGILSCLTPVGRLTGLEATTVYVRDYPAADTYDDDHCPERIGVEGFYLLRDDIELPDYLPDYIPQPVPFPTKDSVSLQIAITIAAVRDTYKNSERIQKAWNKWAILNAPKNDNVNDYLSQRVANQVEYHVPLREEIFGRSTYINYNIKWWTQELLTSTSTVNPPVTLPSLLALAMPSVVTRFNKKPPPSRKTVTDNEYIEDIARRYKFAADIEIITRKILKVDIQSYLRSHLKPVTGNVSELQQRCIEALCGFVVKFFCPILPVQIENYKSEVLMSSRSEVFSAFEFGPETSVLYDDVAPVLAGEDIPVRFMNAMVQLVIAKEYHLVTSYYSRNSENLTRVIILPPCMSWMGATAFAEAFVRSTQQPIYSNVAFIGKPIHKNGRWYFCVLDLAAKTNAIKIYNPHFHDVDEDFAGIKNEIRDEVKDLVQSVLTTRPDLVNLLRPELVQLLPADARDGQEFSSDSKISGISVFIAMVFLISRVPLFCPNAADIENIRYLMVHWVKARALPT